MFPVGFVLLTDNQYYMEREDEFDVPDPEELKKKEELKLLEQREDSVVDIVSITPLAHDLVCINNLKPFSGLNREDDLFIPSVPQKDVDLYVITGFPFITWLLDTCRRPSLSNLCIYNFHSPCPITSCPISLREPYRGTDKKSNRPLIELKGPIARQGGASLVGNEGEDENMNGNINNTVEGNGDAVSVSLVDRKRARDNTQDSRDLNVPVEKKQRME
jgi:hypothetical protein